MKRSSPAIGIVAAIGAAAALIYWVSTWPEWLRTATGPLDEAACAHWRAQAEAAERKRAGWFMVYEGFARLQGVCLPKDEERGRKAIESALALRLSDRLAIDYVIALRAAGDEARATDWAAIATQVVILRKTPFEWIDSILRPGVGFDATEYGFLTHQGDLPGTRQRIERLLARDPVMPDLEAEALLRWLSRLSARTQGDYRFLSYRAVHEGRIQPRKGDSALALLEGAVRCGHPEAIRTLATRFAREPSFDTGYSRLAGAVASLDRQTGQESELLAEVLARQNRTLEDVLRRGEIRAFEESRDLFCGAEVRERDRSGQ